MLVKSSGEMLVKSSGEMLVKSSGEMMVKSSGEMGKCWSIVAQKEREPSFQHSLLPFQDL